MAVAILGGHIETVDAVTEITNPVQISDGTTTVNVDADGGSLATVDHVMYESHVGSLHTLSAINRALADEGTFDMLLWTPTTKVIHADIQVLAGGDANFEVMESVTVTGRGTNVVAYNTNRDRSVCGDTALLVASHTPTGVNFGLVMQSSFLAGGTKSFASGSAHQGLHIVLEANSSYLVRVRNWASATKPAAIHINFAEETPA